MNTHEHESLLRRTFPVDDTAAGVDDVQGHQRRDIEVGDDVEGHRLLPAEGPGTDATADGEADVEGHMQPPRDLDIERM